MTVRLTLVIGGFPAMAEGLGRAGHFQQIIPFTATSGLRNSIAALRDIPKHQVVFLFTDRIAVDTPQTLEFLAQGLAGRGYRVVMLGTGLGARSIAERYPETIGLVDGPFRVNTVLGALSGLPGVGLLPASSEEWATLALDPDKPFPQTPPLLPRTSPPASATPPGGWDSSPAPTAPTASGWDSTSAPTGWDSAPALAPTGWDSAPAPAAPAPTGWDSAPAPAAPAPTGWDSAPAPAPTGWGDVTAQTEPVAEPVVPGWDGRDWGSSSAQATPEHPAAPGTAPWEAAPAPAPTGWDSAPAPAAGGWDSAPAPAPTGWDSAPAPTGWDSAPAPAAGGWDSAPAPGGWDSAPAPAAPAAGGWGDSAPASGWGTGPSAGNYANQESSWADERQRYGGRRGFVIVFTAPSGGVGKSTVSTNLAAYMGLRLQATNKTVALIDTNVQNADVGKILGKLDPTVVDVARNQSAITLANIQQNMIYRRDLNLSVLLGPPSPELASPGYINGKLYRDIVNELRKGFDYLIIDTSVSDMYHDVFMNFVIPEMDFMVLIAVPNYGRLLNIDQWLRAVTADRHAGGYGVDPRKIAYMLNQAKDGVDCSESDVREELASWSYLGKIPDSIEWERAVNNNELVANKNFTDLHRSFDEILYRVTGEQAFYPQRGGGERKGGGLGDLLGKFRKKK